MSLAFARNEFEARVAGAQAAMAAEKLDALIVTSPENICYLSGFWTAGYHVFQALVVPSQGEPFLVIRNIEVDNVAEHSWLTKAYPINNLDIALTTLGEAMRAENVASGKVGVEMDGARFSIVRMDLLAEQMPKATFVPSSDIVEKLRAVKSEREIGYIRQAVAKAEQALIAGVRRLQADATDSDVAAAVQAELAMTGSEFTGSPSYVVEGVASGRAHAVHGGRPIPKDGYAWLEVSASVNRYQGVSSRIAGTAINDDARKYFDVSVAALEAMMKAMRPGVTAGDVDAAGRAVADKAGAGGMWKNRAAYSLGLSFPPGLGEGHIIDLKPNDKRLIKAGMVFHVIPILKVPNVGSVACTETILATEDGGQRLGKLAMAALTPSMIKQPSSRVA